MSEISTAWRILIGMTSKRAHTSRTGVRSWYIVFRLDGKQTSVPFRDEKKADQFRALADAVGPKRAMEIEGYTDVHKPKAEELPTVEQWVTRHIDGLSGIEAKTRTEYRRYLRNDIAPVLGPIQLDKLGREDVARWINAMHKAGAKAGTMQNKHGFLSGVLKQAVKDGHLPGNPCDGVRLPRTEERETVFLDRAEFQILKAAFTEHYQPLVQFLVASGCRFNEAVALKPSDVDRKACTVRIQRAWKQDGTNYTMGPPKTQKSNRTINVPMSVLDQLDYSHEWLFATTKGEPVRLSTWRTNVWNKSRAKAMAPDEADPDKPVLTKSPTPHDMRHTCASWMIQAGVPLPVIQAHLGHESITTTVDRYGHLDRSSHQAASAAIAAMLG